MRKNIYIDMAIAISPESVEEIYSVLYRVSVPVLYAYSRSDELSEGYRYYLDNYPDEVRKESPLERRIESQMKSIEAPVGSGYIRARGHTWGSEHHYQGRG